MGVEPPQTELERRSCEVLMAIRDDLRHGDVLDLVEAGAVNLGGILPSLCPSGEMRTFGRQDRRLHAVEPTVDALDAMLMLH